MTEPTISLVFAPDGLRKCGSCTLCCKLLPNRETNKPANERCQHQRSTGCRIYPDRPFSCRTWNCAWLGNAEETADMSRPDRVHYVVDIAPDYVKATHNETGEQHTIPVVQVWVDPHYPDAHRDPALRAYLAKKGLEGWAAMIRYGTRDGFLLVPPAMSETREFHEHKENMRVDPNRTHNLVDIARELNAEAERRKAKA